jgi:hypothetical protein
VFRLLKKSFVKIARDGFGDGLIGCAPRMLQRIIHISRHAIPRM